MKREKEGWKKSGMKTETDWRGEKKGGKRKRKSGGGGWLVTL